MSQTTEERATVARVLAILLDEFEQGRNVALTRTPDGKVTISIQLSSNKEID